MKLLLDANISWRLLTRLKPHFKVCQHVDNIGLTQPARDIEIWNYAAEHDFIIVTNDEDFINLANAKGFPPKVILLRTGNQSSTYICDILLNHINDIYELASSSEYGFLEMF